MSVFQMIEVEDATGEVAELYEDIQRDMGIPFVPNIDKALASAPNVLKGTWEVTKNVFLQTTLPMSLAMMILYKIASGNNCEYCASIHKVNCMSSGIDEDTLAALESDLEALSPVRVQTILRFAEKCAFDRHNLTDADYDEVRDQGVTDEEMIEIVALTALSTYLDIIADSLKLDVDDVIKQALAG